MIPQVALQGPLRPCWEVATVLGSGTYLTDWTGEMVDTAGQPGRASKTPQPRARRPSSSGRSAPSKSHGRKKRQLSLPLRPEFRSILLLLPAQGCPQSRRLTPPRSQCSPRGSPWPADRAGQSLSLPCPQTAWRAPSRPACTLRLTSRAKHTARRSSQPFP